MAGMRNRDLTDKEYCAIHDYFFRKEEYRNMLIFSVQRWAGYRIAETLSLQVKDLFNANGTMKAKIDIARHKMKCKVKRLAIPIHDDLKHDLIMYKKQMEADDDFYMDRFLFQSRKGDNKPISTIQAWRIIKAAYDDLDIYENVATHALRKSFGVSVYNATGKDIRATQQIFGHSSPAITIKYLPISQQKLEEAILSQ